MKEIILSLFLLGFTACGSNSRSNMVAEAEDVVEPEDVVSESLHRTYEDNRTHNPNKTITIYVHGFSSTGADKTDRVFGEDRNESFFNDIPKFMGVSTINNKADENKSNIFTTTTYYGNIAPSYYTQKDIEELEDISDEFGGGIPRYALILAKYTKYIMARTSAKQVNYIGASMGALVSRYLIEKNLENLASEKKIARWLTVEGVVNGNYIASKNDLIEILELFERPSIDVEHMSYEWIENYLVSSRTVATSPYYKDILIGHESSTKDNLSKHALTTFLFLNGQFESNDAYQIVSDTHFHDVALSSRFNEQLPTHSYFHVNHLSIKSHKGAWAQIATFLTSNKRVKITLTKAKINNVHESEGKWYEARPSLPAEIVFSSKVFSPEVNNRWEIEEEISNITVRGATPPIVKYYSNGEEKILNQILFDDFVLENEKELNIELEVKEIDQDARYGVYEKPWKGKRDYDSIGNSSVKVPLNEGTYSFSNDNYSYDIKVELVNYNFTLLDKTNN